MIDINVFYQVNLFSNLNDITATPENTVKLLTLFGDFGLLPSTIHELNNNSMTPLIRPRLQSPNGDFAVTIFSQNILIERNFTGEHLETVEEFIEKVKSILDLFMREFNKQGKRIGITSKSLLNEMPSEQLDSIYNKFSRPINFYSNEGTPFEWNLRSVRKIDYSLHEIKESCNVITTLSRMQGQMNKMGTVKNLDRISLDFDINTLLQSDINRFTNIDVYDFLRQAVRTREDIISEMESQIYG